MFQPLIHQTKKLAMVLSLTLAILTSTATAQGWQVINFPTQDNLTGVFFPTPDTGYVVTRSGTVARTTDAGKSWGGVQISKTPLEDIYFSDTRTVYVCGGNGLLLKSEDAGRNWVDRSVPDTSITLLSVRRVTPLSLITTGLTHDSAKNIIGVLMRSTDDGHSWSRLPVTGIGFGELQVTPDKTVRFLSWGWLNSSNDFGATWTQIKLPEGKPGRTLDVRGNTGIMAGNFGQVAISSDHGATWTQITLPEENAHFTSALLVNDKVGYVAGFESRLYNTSDGGRTWSRQQLPIACEILAMTKSANRIWAVGAKGAMIWKQIK
jgi:photosystem II stability/assembly factor-like uncharacterized protein